MEEKRRFIRFDAAGNCRILQGSAAIDGQLVDLSLGGIQVRTSALVDESRKVRMTFELADLPRNTVIGASATVVRAPGDYVGLRFDGVDGISAERLRHWIRGRHDDEEAYRRELLVSRGLPVA